MKNKGQVRKTLRYDHLSLNEIREPRLIIAEFFIDDTLCNHLQLLNSWSELLCSDKCIPLKCNFAAELVSEYLSIRKLLQAVWLLQEEQQQQGLKEPYISFKQLFEVFDLRDYCELLELCLVEALSKYPLGDFLEVSTLNMLYVNLKKLCQSAEMLVE